MTSYKEYDGMGLFTGFLKVLWIIVATATACFFIGIGIIETDPGGTMWIMIGLFVLFLVGITAWFARPGRAGAWQ
jgi:hypothetical protein